MNLKKLFFAAVIVLSANATFAQADSKIASHLVTISIPEVALLDLEAPLGATDITLNGTAPTEAGDPLTFGPAATNSAIWMNYSSIVKKDKLRNVSVAITGGAVPAGLKLTVLASAASADGAGTKGIALGAAHTLTGSVTSLVSGIGSTWTDNGVNKGRNLTYKLDYATDVTTDYSKLNFDTVLPITITYTLSDNL